MILELMPYWASYPILKLVYSAAANASHNMGLNEADLFISKAEVNRGTIVKKLKPRARGRSYLIKKTTCHIKIDPKENNFVSTELKQEAEGSSKPKPSFSSYLASISPFFSAKIEDLVTIESFVLSSIDRSSLLNIFFWSLDKHFNMTLRVK